MNYNTQNANIVSITEKLWLLVSTPVAKSIMPEHLAGETMSILGSPRNSAIQSKEMSEICAV